MKTRITIAIQCHNYQKRLCWMLSSIAQQTQPERVNVIVDAVNGNGSPTTESVVAHFVEKEKLNVSLYTWPDDSRFRFRGVVRNRQILIQHTEWFMFGDCDLVYSPDYFEKLLAHMDQNHPKHKGLISSGRMSNDKIKCTRLVNSEVGSAAMTVTSAFEKANGLELIRKSNVGAGFCQIFSTKHGAHGFKYVDKNRDWDWNKGGWNTKSDMSFRGRMRNEGESRIALPLFFTQNAIHLNHNRDPDSKVHLSEQR